MIFGWHFLAIAMYMIGNGITQYRYREEKAMAKLFIRLIGAVIGSAPYVAALWMIMNGYNW